MGWCHEFGPQIHEGCSHPMVAGPGACRCSQCGAVCEGRFNACAAVWERGPVAVTAVRPFEPMVLAQASADGRRPDDFAAADLRLGTASERVSVPEPRPASVFSQAPPAPAAASPRRRMMPTPGRLAPDMTNLNRSLASLRGELRSLGASVDHRVGSRERR